MCIENMLPCEYYEKSSEIIWKKREEMLQVRMKAMNTTENI